MPKSIKALKVNQWLKEWDLVDYNKADHRAHPEKHFYIFSLSARQLRSLSGVNRRDAKSGKKRSLDLGIQRAHEEFRSANIAEYVKYGYPWSDLSESQRKAEFNDLRKPGWLPTAIVVNILKEDDMRRGKMVAASDLISISDSASGAEIKIPSSDGDWEPKQIHPLEVIDGQHRLLAFDDGIDEDFQLPVVAFHGLDLSWQAYLFWTVNIKPKRINPSLAFDLYPLLRTEDWLEKFEGHKVYREARSQELVECLWSEPSSTWYKRINMLGERGVASVTQAAWIRALLKTYVKAYEGRGVTIGGLYGAKAGADKMVIPWDRSQQAALLIYLWNSLEDAVKSSREPWAKKLRKTVYKKKVHGDPAFTGPHTLLNNDQGITVVLNVTNDLLFVNADSLYLKDWIADSGSNVAAALKDLKKQSQITEFIDRMGKALSSFDWRSSGASDLTERERTIKLSYRGGSGYREFRRQLLKHLSSDSYLADDAKTIYKDLGYN